MPDDPRYPYATHLDVKFPPLTTVDDEHRAVILMVETSAIVPTGDA